MHNRQISMLTGFTISGLLVLTALVSQTFAQESEQNPTPIVITLTPGGYETVVPNPTGDGSLQPDRFEPNNNTRTATEVGLQIESDLTLVGDDVDYFTGYFKAGQMVRVSTAVYQGLDTRLKVYRDGQLVAENDDRSVADMGSTVIVTAVS
ncbi:MAG: hypothetical protein GY942_20745, partial [Aestuariibacter sp.]|nr:hypothetical protein [Aestuariibacter sp.]